VKKIAALYLFKRSGELLLQHRSDDAPNFPGYWGPFGGAVEEGETLSEAVRRELKEELDYDVQAPRLFEQYEMHYKGNGYLVHVFVEEYSGAPLTLNEGQGLGWFDAAGLQNLLLNEHDKSTTRALAKALADGSLA